MTSHYVCACVRMCVCVVLTPCIVCAIICGYIPFLTIMELHGSFCKCVTAGDILMHRCCIYTQIAIIVNFIN